MKNLKLYIIFSFLLVTSIENVEAQAVNQMQKLEAFVGDWVGVSSSYEKGEIIKQVPAYEKISYKIEKHILTIDLYSENLKLHTVIFYDEKDSTYYYNPYYKGGTAKYPAKLVDKKLIVSPSENKRFIFEITADSEFREYGENYKNGKWMKYFEDVFQKQ